MTDLRASTASADVRLYIYDTSNGWCAQAQTGSNAFQSAAGNAPEGVDAPLKLVTAVMVLQSPGHPSPSDSALQLPSEAAELCLGYLSSTQTFAHVCKAYGRPSGHWLAVLYRFEDQEPILRPAFLIHPSDTLSRHELASWVAQTVEHDRTATGGDVHRLVFNGRGPTLSSLLR